MLIFFEPLLPKNIQRTQEEQWDTTILPKRILNFFLSSRLAHPSNPFWALFVFMTAFLFVCFIFFAFFFFFQPICKILRWNAWPEKKTTNSSTQRETSEIVLDENQEYLTYLTATNPPKWRTTFSVSLQSQICNVIRKQITPFY